MGCSAFPVGPVLRMRRCLLHHLFTAETWREARENPEFADTGHREGARNRAKVKPGDIFLRCLTKTSAFVGAEGVKSEV